jgi:hypothetical protein
LKGIAEVIDGSQQSGSSSGRAGGDDWLERMRQRDAELQARIAKHDARLYSTTDSDTAQ